MNRLKIIEVKPLEKYKIKVQFNDGTTGVLDLSDLAGKEAFHVWDEDDNFNKVYIDQESGAIAWPGNLGIDTLNAWLQIKNISYEEYKSSMQTHAIR